MPLMTPERFTALVEAYGGRPERWPDGEREAALALNARSPEARARCDDASRLDRLLDALPAGVPSPELAARIMAGTPRAASLRRRHVGTAAATLALAASLAVWLVRTPTSSSPLAPEAMAQLGVLDVPTDALLSDLDVDDEAPAFGCDDPSLGCADEPADPAALLERDASPERMVV
jgi:hypothetical protein